MKQKYQTVENYNDANQALFVILEKDERLFV